jgi:hypothetical protein
MHNGFLNVDNEKMSKSLGNFFTIRDVLKDYDGETCASSCCARTTAAPSTSATPTWTTPARRCAGSTRPWCRSRAGCPRWTGRILPPSLQGGHGRRLQHAGGAGRAVRVGH